MGNRKNADCWFYAVNMVLLVELFSLFQPIYTNIDNYCTSMIINQVYAEDDYNMFLNPVVCWVSTFLGQLFPDADGFLMLTRAVLLVGIGAVSYFIALHFKHWSERLFWGAMFFFLIIEMNLFSDFFMVWSAFLSFVGMIWLLHALKGVDVNKKWILTGTFFLCCGLMWRLGGFCLFVPFILLDVGINFLFTSHGKKEKLQYIKKCCKVFLPVVLSVLVLLTLDYGCKHSEKYEDSVSFCDEVSRIVDYPMKEYDEVKEQLSGISRNDYESLQNYLYVDTDQITAEYCDKIASAGYISAFRFDIKELVSKTYSLIARFYGLINFRIWCIALGIIGMLFILSRAPWYYKLELFFAGIGAYLIMIYLTFAGRLPERIMQSVLYAVMGTVLILYMSQRDKRHEPKIWKDVAVLAFSAIIVLHLGSVEFVPHQSIWTAQTGALDMPWEELYDSDTIYIWNVRDYIKNPMKYFMQQGKMEPEDFMAHNICAGDWDFTQLCNKERLNHLGVPNPARALLEREKTYYIANDCDDMWTYLKEHFDPSVQAVQIGEIKEIPIWEFRSKNF